MNLIIQFNRKQKIGVPDFIPNDKNIELKNCVNVEKYNKLPYSEVEKPDLNPDFYNQKSYMDLHELDLNDLYLETCLGDW